MDRIPKLNVWGILYNQIIKKGNQMSNILKTDELLANLVKSGLAKENTKYAYAFGMAWANLTEQQRQAILNTAEKAVKENN